MTDKYTQLLQQHLNETQNLMDCKIRYLPEIYDQEAQRMADKHNNELNRLHNKTRNTLRKTHDAITIERAIVGYHTTFLHRFTYQMAFYNNQGKEKI